MNSNDAELFKERLYYYMKDQNLTLNRVAVLSGITASTLNNIINRGSAPRLDTMHRLCTGLGISVHDFFDFPPYNEVEK